MPRNNQIIDLELFTDGSCRKLTPTSGTGFIAYGFAAVEDNNMIHIEVDRIDSPTSTSQRAELLAIINALKFADQYKKKLQRVIIYSDSAYAINGLNNWIHGWRANGWRNSKKEEVANLDLWLILNPYVDLIDYSFQKVKGHADNIWNNKVDEMVQNQTLDAKMNWRGKENAE